MTFSLLNHYKPIENIITKDQSFFKVTEKVSSQKIVSAEKCSDLENKSEDECFEVALHFSTLIM